jgi:aminotransferase
MISVFGSKYTEEDINGVIECLKSNWTGIGENVRKFEMEFKKRLSVDNFTMLDSGSNALFLALKNLNLPLGSEVILPSFTWVSCAQSVLMNGLKPIFCDVDLLSQNVTVELISKKITEKTSAIMIVHYAGLPVDIKPILELGYPVIEDTAHAVDSKIGNQYCGTFGDVGIWSFDSVKNIAVGEGGGIYFKNLDLSNKSIIMRYCGIGFSGFQSSKNNKDLWWEYDIKDPNIKMLPSDIEGSLALTQLKNLNSNQTRRKEIWDFYQKSFKSTSIITPVNEKENETHSYFTYFIQVDEKLRNSLAKFLYENGIYTTLRYHPLHLNSIYNSNTELKNCEILNKTGLNIPLHQNLSDNDVNYIVESIKKFIK